MVDGGVVLWARCWEVDNGRFVVFVIAGKR